MADHTYTLQEIRRGPDFERGAQFLAVNDITTEEGHLWQPYTDGWSVGFKVTHASTKAVRYVWLTPAGADDLGEPTVFLCEHDKPDGEAETVCYLTPFDNTKEQIQR